jgi:MoaA/NifB/PqqE/SkfB family radical SAM enzyme
MRETLISAQAPYNATLELFTEDCNLRCRYCPIQTDKSDMPEYPRRTMEADARDHIAHLFSQRKPNFVDLCGNGETTILDNWIEICRPFFDCAENVGIISNLAKVFSKEEIAFLATFGHIRTSIDTADANLLKEIRYPVQLRNIALTLVATRASALAQGRPPPGFSINCTVTTKTYGELVELVALASSLHIDLIQLASLFETPTSVQRGIRSIASLPPSGQDEVMREVERARKFGASIGVTVDSTYVERRISMEDHAGDGGADSAETTTVFCMQPWNGFWINADGHASFCCRNMGKTDRHVTAYSSVDEIMNDESAVSLRKQLLLGPAPERCQTCDLGRPSTSRGLIAALNPQSKSAETSAATNRRRVLRKVRHALARLFRRIAGRLD